MALDPALQARVDAVRERIEIAAVVSGAIRLVGRGNPRGQCPFHGSKSDSFAVYPETGRAKCWGCGWSGDAIRFVSDYYALPFMEALKRLEQDCNLAGLEAAPARRDKAPQAARRHAPSELVDAATLGRFIWRTARPDPARLRTYFRGRGVPEAILGEHRFAQLRLNPSAPLVAWPEDRPRPSPDWPAAPAMAAMIRRPVTEAEAAPPASFAAIGLHVTYLAPGLGGKLDRKRRDGSKWPARKMLGEAMGGGVLLPGAEAGPEGYDREAPLYVGEGIETVLSGMALHGAPPEAIGLAVLSLDNLQGGLGFWKRGVWPIFDMAGDPLRPPLCFAHDGPVIGLIDADMKPLRGPLDRQSGEPLGLPIVERRGGPIVNRAVTPAERSAICAKLFVEAWRRAGCREVSAWRPHMGQDFNDAAREAAA